MSWLSRQNAYNDKSLVGFWPLQNDLFDNSGVRNHASFTTAGTDVFPSFTYLNNKKGFNCRNSTADSDNWLSVTSDNSLSFNATDKFSISCWVLLYENTHTNAGLIGKTSTGTVGYSFNLTTNNAPAFIFFGSGGTLSVSANLSSNEVPQNLRWHHYVITYDGSSLASGVNFYLNGRKILNTTITVNTLSGTTTSSDNLLIGRKVYGGSNETPKAALSLGRVYKRELTYNDVRNLYNNELSLVDKSPKFSKVPSIYSVNIASSLRITDSFSDNSILAGNESATLRINSSINAVIPQILAISGVGTLRITSQESASKVNPASISDLIQIVCQESGIRQRTGQFSSSFEIVSNVSGVVTDGIFTFSGICPLFLQGPIAPTKNNNIPLFINSLSASNSGVFAVCDLFIEGTGGLNATLPLFIKSSENPASGVLKLFIRGNVGSVNNNLTLFLQNLGSTSGIPLYIKGLGTTAGSVPLSSYMSLFINRPTSEVITLFIAGPGYSSSGDLTLFTEGCFVGNNNIPIYVSGVGFSENNLKLFMSGW